MEFYKCGYSCVFSVYMTKLYETQASELSIVILLHDNRFVYKADANLLKEYGGSPGKCCL